MKTMSLATSLTALMAAPALADTAIGLAGDRTLVTIDLETAEVTGMQDADYDGRILGIDFRPATNTVIAVTDEFAVVNLDPETGEWTLVVEMSEGMEIGDDAPVIVDINPVPDALRFMSGTTNHRINLTTGAVMIDGELHFGDDTDGTPMVGGTAYSNSFGSPDETTMFNIDTDLAAMLIQTAPNDGINEMHGALDVAFDGPIGFDIVTDSDGMNTGWLSANGALHTVSLEEGGITNSWEIEGLDVTLRDITILPTMD